MSLIAKYFVHYIDRPYGLFVIYCTCNMFSTCADLMAYLLVIIFIFFYIFVSNYIYIRQLECQWLKSGNESDKLLYKKTMSYIQFFSKKGIFPLIISCQIFSLNIVNFILVKLLSYVFKMTFLFRLMLVILLHCCC